MAGARSDINEGLQLVPDDLFGWYISSALALKEGLLARAQDDIAEAVRLAPEDPNLLVHAGNVAGISGEIEAAKGLYAKAIRVAPDSDAAKAARAALAANASPRSEEHTSELQSLMRISYAVFCLKKNKQNTTEQTTT